MQIEDKLPELIKVVEKTCKDIDGPYKVALLKTVAAHFENLSQSEMQIKMMQEAFKKII